MLTLEGPLPAWDATRARAEVAPLIAWLIAAIRRHGVEVASLERLHERADAATALELSRTLSFSLSVGEGKRLVHALLAATLPRLPWRELAVQTVPHVRVLVPHDTIAPVPPHADHDIGHAPFERNLWFALTDALGSRALRLTRFSESMHLLAARDGPLFSPTLALPHAEARVGEVLLFTPLHVHAAQVVREDATRVSMDLRIAPLEAVRRRALKTFVPHVEAGQ